MQIGDSFVLCFACTISWLLNVCSDAVNRWMYSTFTIYNFIRKKKSLSDLNCKHVFRNEKNVATQTTHGTKVEQSNCSFTVIDNLFWRRPATTTSARPSYQRNRMRMENINVKLQNIFFFIGLLIAIQCATATANECLCFGRTQRMHSTPMEKPLNQKKKRKRHLSAAAVAATVRNLQWKKNISAPLVARHCQVVKLHRALCIGSFIGSTAQLDWYFYHNWFNETGFSLSFSRCQSTSSSRHVPATSGQTITFISSSCIQQVVEWLRWNSFMEWIQFLAAHEQWTCLTACTQ